MSSRVNRRGAFRKLLEETARGAELVGREVVPMLGDKSAGSTVGKKPPRRRRAHAGRATASQASLPELMAWVEESRLAGRSGAIRDAARLSFRATPAEPSQATGQSRIGGSPDPSDQSGVGAIADSVAQFAFPPIAGLDTECVGDGGRLSIFLSLSESVVRRRYEIGRCSGHWRSTQTGERGEAVRPENGQPVLLTPELILPRVWSAGPQALGLDDEEQEAWESLRTRLARAQGVQPFDGLPGLLILHRVFGYPDERTGDLPLLCEMYDRGMALDGGPVRAHPEIAELRGSSSRWRLLLQLSRGRGTGPVLGRGRERMYVWVDEDRFGVQDFSQLYAIKV